MNRQDMIQYLEEQIKRAKEEGKKAYDEKYSLMQNPEERYWSGIQHMAEDILHKLKYDI